MSGDASSSDEEEEENGIEERAELVMYGLRGLSPGDIIDGLEDDEEARRIAGDLEDVYTTVEDIMTDLIEADKEGVDNEF